MILFYGRNIAFNANTFHLFDFKHIFMKLNKNYANLSWSSRSNVKCKRLGFTSCSDLNTMHYTVKKICICKIKNNLQMQSWWNVYTFWNFMYIVYINKKHVNVQNLFFAIFREIFSVVKEATNITNLTEIYL